MVAQMKYLCCYAQDSMDFRLQELEAIASLFDIIVTIHHKDYDSNKPYLLIELEKEEHAKLILSRTVLIKYIIELWSTGSTFADAGHEAHELNDKMTNLFGGTIRTFKFAVDIFNKKITYDDRVYYIEEIQKYVAIPGEIDMKNPDTILSLLLDFGDGNNLSRLYFGRQVGEGHRKAVHKYNLKNRYFIGNTSMDPMLSMIMANQANVKKGSLCYDPFVGTGSIILACSHFGGYCAGNDIDYNIIYGRGKTSRANVEKAFRERDEIIRTNYEHYGLQSLFWDVLAADATCLPMRITELFDVIVTDPPYGIREGGRKLGSKKDTTWEIPAEVRDEHIPAKRSHTLSSVISDLLDFAIKYLVVGGRLVYWLPVYKPSYSEESIPQHPGLQLIANSEQNLTKTVSRRLITMEKILSLQEIKKLPIDAVSMSQTWREEQNDFRNNYFSLNPTEKGAE